MMKLKKNQIKRIAKLHSAIHLSHVDSFMFGDNSEVSEEDQAEIISEINKIAERIAEGMPMNLAHTDKIVEYVKNNF